MIHKKPPPVRPPPKKNKIGRIIPIRPMTINLTATWVLFFLTDIRVTAGATITVITRTIISTIFSPIIMLNIRASTMTKSVRKVSAIKTLSLKLWEGSLNLSIMLSKNLKITLYLPRDLPYYL